MILTALTFPSIGQEIDKVIFTSQQTDEPPTKQRRPKYSIEFKRLASNELSTFDFYDGKRKRKLNDKLTIDEDRTKKITEWEKQDKRTFTQSDLGLDIATLRTQPNNHKLNFDLPTDLIVSVDSFQFCQTYKMTKSTSTGGETLTVTLIYSDDQKKEFIFDLNDTEEVDFNLRDYIRCYALLADKIPNEVPSYGFFSKSKFTEIVLYYQKTVECEGYYYKEFTDKNPTMTSKDKRIMTGWNFVEYMGQRNGKE
jgi:hypothetical protein